MASILKVNTIQDATNSNTAMTISSGGVISEPNRPCFHVSKTADQSLSDGTVSTITFESITDGGDSGRVINKGGLFASNKFTVTSTTTGIYFFYTNLFAQSSADGTDTLYTSGNLSSVNVNAEQIGITDIACHTVNPTTAQGLAQVYTIASSAVVSNTTA